MTSPLRGALDKNPETVNMLAQQNFKFIVKRLPNVNFFLQQAEIPDITLPSAIQATPFVDIPLPGNKLTFGDLTIQFKLDEDLTNYIELNNWMMGVGFPENTQEYGVLARKDQRAGEGLLSDCSIISTSNLKNPNLEFVFQDCWPTYIGSFQYSTTPEDINFLTIKAIFKYLLFKVQVLPK